MQISKLLSQARKHQPKLSKFVRDSKEGRDEFEMVGISFDVFQSFLRIKYEDSDDVAQALRGLVLSAAKSLQAATLLSLSGLEVPTLSILRDVIEIEYLLRYFLEEPKELGAWWTAGRKIRLHKYRPFLIRDKIAKNDIRLKQKYDASTLERRL